MKVEHINPFLRATVDVFKQTASIDLQRGEIALKVNSVPSLDISGLISLTGIVGGLVVVSVDQKVALKVAEAMLQEPFDTVNNDVIDLVGELTNMIAGKAKAGLAQFKMTLGLPTVVTGTNHEVRFPSDVQPISIPFTSDSGRVVVDVGLSED